MSRQQPQQAGILGLGAYLPPTVRTNDWWPAEVARSWIQEDAEIVPERRKQLEAKTEGERLVLEAMAQYRDDPFYGYKERRVLPDEFEASFMEIEAARSAIEESGVAIESIDLVLGFSALPDFLMSPNPCGLHKKLGLRPDCMVLATDSTCNSFLHQLCLANGMIASGQCENVLLVQSTLLSRIVVPTSPPSAWFGDAATAAIVGPVGAELGVRSSFHFCDGASNDSLVTTVPGGRWYDEGLPVMVPQVPDVARSIILSVPDHGKHVVDGALAAAGLEPKDVDFYASHQATPWFLRVTQDFIGLNAAASIDILPWAGHVSACSIPLSLFAANQEGLIDRGDLVATYSGGTGLTCSSVLFRWGH